MGNKKHIKKKRSLQNALVFSFHSKCQIFHLCPQVLQTQAVTVLVFFLNIRGITISKPRIVNARII